MNAHLAKALRHARRGVELAEPTELRRVARESARLTLAELERDRLVMTRVEVETKEADAALARAEVLCLYERGELGEALRSALARWSAAERALVEIRRSAREAEAQGSFFGGCP